MPDLLSLVTGYLVSDGFNVQQRELAREVIGERPGPAGTRDRVYVWVPEINANQPFSSQEAPYLERFARANERHPSATKVLVVPSTGGISTDFRTKANRVHRVGIRVPIQFFDTEFTWEYDADLATTAKQLKSDGAEADSNGIAQPYAAKGRYAGHGPDLVLELFRRLHDYPRHTGIHIVEGPAGIGKSHLFASLFARLHNAFLEDKARQRTRWGRPLPLMPEYDPGQLRLNGLLTVFMQTELERLIPPSLFHWMLANGQSIWMLDGLEEIMARDNEFTQIILDSFTLPNSASDPTILICLRDSLMNTNQAVIDFCNEYEDYTTVYTLKRWNSTSIASFASLKIDKRQSRAFTRQVTSNPKLLELASLPYYCNLLAHQFNDGGFREATSASTILNDALEGIIRREYAKGMALSEDNMPVDDVFSFAQEIAQHDMQSGFNGISVGMIRALAGVWADLVWEDAQERERFVFQMSQMALFSQDPSTRRLRFAQEILEQYLLGRLYVDYLRKDEVSRLVDEFNYWEFPEGSITLQLLADYFSQQESTAVNIQSVVLAALHKPTAFKNMIHLLNLANVDATFFGQSLIGKDLSNLKFREMDLSNVSFSACDLSNTEFRGCKLHGTDFSGAIVNNTGFFDVSDDSMQGANFRDMSKFHSMRVDRSQPLVRTSEARQWWSEITNEVEEVSNLPCGAAEQLRHLFMKFIYPDGRGRRDDLQEAFLNRGQRRVQDPGTVSSAAIKHGYLNRSSPSKFRRADGMKYAEMVEFVKEFNLSHDLRFLLDDVCANDGCLHVEA